MSHLRLGPIADEKPVKIAIELPAALHRDLIAYADLLGKEQRQPIDDPTRLIVPMLQRFMAMDRSFIKAGRSPPFRSGADG